PGGQCLAGGLGEGSGVGVGRQVEAAVDLVALAADEALELVEHLGLAGDPTGADGRQDAQLVERVRGGDDLFDPGGDPVAAGPRVGADERIQGGQDRAALEDVAALEEQGLQDLAELVDAAALGQFGGQLGGGGGDVVAQQCGGQPEAEQSEPGQQ